MGSDKKERSILDYQTQQEKVIPRIAEYYAVTIAGTKIRLLSEENNKRVLNNDFSLLKETHSTLCFSKCLFSEIIQDGMEILRRSMGGHGTSYYSGVPQVMNEYIAHNTHEGENTVMYLQTAMYVLKSYIGFITKGKSLTDSVKYIARIQELSDVRFAGKNPWTVEEFRDLLVRAIGYVISKIAGRIASKEQGQKEKDVVNYKVGIKLQQLAQLHGVYFMVNQFVENINR